MTSKNGQKGSALAILAGILIFIIVGAILVAMAVMSMYNGAKDMENGLNATYQNNQQILASYRQKITEAAQVPGMMTEDLERVYKATMEGRYGANGSRAMFQMLQEQNPNLPASLYENLQPIVIAGRDEYKMGQTTQIDKLRLYKNKLEQMPSGIVLKFLGFPRKDLAMYEPIITDEVANTYSTGREEAVKLRPAPAAQ